MTANNEITVATWNTAHRAEREMLALHARVRERAQPCRCGGGGGPARHVRSGIGGRRQDPPHPAGREAARPRPDLDHRYGRGSLRRAGLVDNTCVQSGLWAMTLLLVGLPQHALGPPAPCRTGTVP